MATIPGDKTLLAAYEAAREAVKLNNTPETRAAVVAASAAYSASCFFTKKRGFASRAGMRQYREMNAGRRR
jgi:hypothetical protein